MDDIAYIKAYGIALRCMRALAASFSGVIRSNVTACIIAGASAAWDAMRIMATELISTDPITGAVVWRGPVTDIDRAQAPISEGLIATRLEQ